MTSLETCLSEFWLLSKLINQEMFGTYSFLLEVDVMKTKMILYRMSFTAMSLYYLLTSQCVTRYDTYLI